MEDLEEEQYLNADEQEGQLPEEVDCGKQVDPLDEYMNALNTLPAPLQSKPTPEQYSEEEEDAVVIANQQDEFMSEEGSKEELPKELNRKIIEPLPPLDFSLLTLQPFQKDFYQQHPQIAALSKEAISKLLIDMQIKVIGVDSPRLIVSFAHLNMGSRMSRLISGHSYEQPTPIQCIALPAALSGRDIVGVAKTGSGKTLAYVWPMLTHVAARGFAGRKQGPSALILAPTRELCQQIYVETRKYAKKGEMRVVCLLGGENKHEQWKELKKGVDVLIASPGRLIEMIRKKATQLLRVTFLVLDEADRMLSLGFEHQIRSVVQQTRPDRQTLLFTATMKKQMRFLAGDILSEPLHITVGEENVANQDINQVVVCINERSDKLNWLELHVRELLMEGKILIFVNQRQGCEEVARHLRGLGVECDVLHGEKSQYERTVVMNAFKADHPVLVATDIASRGIDVKNIKSVINFECPADIDSYVHRIGRAGRAGETGSAYTFLEDKDSRFAIALIRLFEGSGYPVGSDLERIASIDEGFRRKRLSSKMGVSFAKGNDATRMLNNALKRQRRDRSGLGANSAMVSQELDPDFVKQVSRGELSISEVAKLVREKYAPREQEQKYGHFVKAETPHEKQSPEATIHFYEKSKKKQRAGREV